MCACNCVSINYQWQASSIYYCLNHIWLNLLRVWVGQLGSWHGSKCELTIHTFSFLASMNSVGEWVETVLSRINIADTKELVEAVESWRLASGGVSLPDDQSRQKAWDLPIVKRNWENMLREADQVSRAVEPDYWPLSRKRAWLGKMLCRFRRLWHYWTPRGCLYSSFLPLQRKDGQ